MKLTLDVAPTLLRSAGVKNHLFYWSRALEETAGGNRLEYYPWTRRLETLDHDRGLERGIPNWRLFFIAAMNRPELHWAAAEWVREAEFFHASPQTRIPPKARKLSAHIHDLTCWLFPEFHTAANVAAARQQADRVWKRADGLIAVSQSAKDDAVRLLGLPEERIRVIHHGVPEEYFDEAGGAPEILGLTEPYVLALGTIEPRKNLDRLLDAWGGLAPDIRETFLLVVAGPVGWKADATLRRLRGTRRVRYLGYVPESHLPQLTAGATALAYPSLYEGFGFPVAQAMACGVPSVTSAISSLPEVAAGSALLVDPRSVSEIRDALNRMLTSPGLQNELGERGRAYARAHYRWEIAARQSWEFFEQVAAKA